MEKAAVGLILGGIWSFVDLGFLSDCVSLPHGELCHHMSKKLFKENEFLASEPDNQARSSHTKAPADMKEL